MLQQQQILSAIVLIIKVMNMYIIVYTNESDSTSKMFLKTFNLTCSEWDKNVYHANCDLYLLNYNN